MQNLERWFSNGTTVPCNGLSVCVPNPQPNSYATVLTPSVMVSGAGAFWRWQDHEVGAHNNSISAP
jgi:hypothetical protein